MLVWLAGGSGSGGFAEGGAGTVDPEEVCRGLVSQGLLFVPLNYRLGPLGEYRSN